MPAFLDPLVITEIDDSIFMVTGHPFRYLSDIVATTIVVPVGFRTDFASVPRLGALYALLGNTAHEPAVIHDYLYAAAITTRKQADDVFLEAMELKGVSWWRRWPIYAGVRAFGLFRWNTQREAGDLVVLDPNVDIHQNDPTR